MAFITGKHIPRRTFLRERGGDDAGVAVPGGDGPCRAPRGEGPRRDRADAIGLHRDGARRRRLQRVGRQRRTSGARLSRAAISTWRPSALAPLEPFRDYLTIVSNTDVRMAEAFEAPEIGGDHFRSSAVFLTQAHPKQTQGSDVHVGTSLDQMYAQRFGQDTPMPSMQLCIENVDQAGGCAYGYTCVYTDSISWASPTTPLPVTRSPRVAFEQLFGVGGTAKERAARSRTDESILDWMAGRVSQLKRELGPEDRSRMDRYLENIREIERRIQMVEARNTSGEPRELPQAPAGVPDSFEEHVKLMFDVQALAFEADVTRVFSFKMGRDSSGRVYPESGTDKPFHSASHHGGNEKAMLEFGKINRYHVSLLPYFLEKLKNTMEGEASLLDKSMIIYGSPMADGNLHNHRRCPLLVLGHANGKLAGGVHVKAADGTPMANPMLSLAAQARIRRHDELRRQHG